MAHFARVENGIVQEVLVAEQEFIDNLKYNKPGEWIQTSYNTIGGVHYQRNDDGSLGEPSADQTKALRKNYAGIGYLYDSEVDAFYEPQPYPSWTLDTDGYVWLAPVAHPNDGVYTWNEETQAWDAVESE
jgi:hypothetical protein